MDSDKIKHLELIQSVVDRQGRNSFSLKGWSVIIVTAILALSVETGGSRLVWLAYIPSITFWGLDAYYLLQEKLFRDLYDAVRLGEPVKPFSMDCSDYVEKSDSWFKVVRSVSVLWFHLPIVLVISVIIYIT